MSKNVDLSKPISPLDAAYLAGRPWIVDRYQRASGITVTYETEEEGAESPPPGSESGEAPSGTESALSAQESTGPGPDDVEEEAEEDYSDWKLAELKAELKSRNEQLDEDEQIEPESMTRAGIITALEADDALEDSEEPEEA